MLHAPRPEKRLRTPTAVSALRRRREALEAAVEAALDALDAIDGDPDLEDGTDRETDADYELDVLDPDEVAGLAEAHAEWGMAG